MITFTDGELFHVQAEGNQVPYELLQDFFAQGHENDLLCVGMASGKKVYINKKDFLENRIDDNGAEILGGG